MQEPKTDPESPQAPLPLFRPEVLASQQQKFYGDVLLIRPFSLGFFAWLGMLLASAVIGLLILRHFTENAHVSPHHSQSVAAKDVKTK